MEPNRTHIIDLEREREQRKRERAAACAPKPAYHPPQQKDYTVKVRLAKGMEADFDARGFTVLDVTRRFEHTYGEGSVKSVKEKGRQRNADK